VRVDAFKRQIDFAIASETPRRRGRGKVSSVKNKVARV